ncbi:hypothetical protein HKD37_20G056387 [Glycine soja]
MTLGCKPGRSHCRALTTSTRANLPHLLHSFISRFISNSNFKSYSILLTSFQSYEEASTKLFHRLNSIAEIDDQKETWKIVVQVINMWTIPRSPKFILTRRSELSLLMLIVQGDKILAQMRNVDVQLDNVIFYVGHTYDIHNFEVENNSAHYKATHHGFKINFVNATKVTPHEIPEIPKKMYNFTMFDDIVSGSISTNFLIDVIGEVVEIGQENLHGKPKKVSLALEFKDCFDRHVFGLVVLLLSLAKIKEARVHMFTYFKIDPTQLTMVLCTQIGSQISGSLVYSLVDRFLHNAQECVCVAVATISKLLVVNGFRVDIKVGQPNESIIFTLWDRECYALIKETTYEIRQKMINEDGVFDARDIPKELDRVLGKRLAFKFKVVPRNTCHSVSQLSNDDDLINFVLSKLPTLQHQPLLSLIQHSWDPSHRLSAFFHCLTKHTTHIPSKHPYAKAITPSITCWALRAQISKLWKIVEHANGNAIGRFKMILFDSQGDQIETSIREDIWNLLSLNMEEGKFYILKNVSVLRNGADFCHANHEYKLEITRFSVVTSMVSESLNQFETSSIRSLY